MECRNLTDRECSELAHELDIPLAVSLRFGQDPDFCPFHELGARDFDQLVVRLKENHDGWDLKKFGQGEGA